MEFKGKYMIGRIFNGLVENYINNLNGFKLLPDFSDNIINNEIDPNIKVRIICDYISGMTDAYALRTYRRLYNPDFTALADLV